MRPSGALALSRLSGQKRYLSKRQVEDRDLRRDFASPLSDTERAIVQFGTVQLFVSTFLQKLAVGPLSFQISLPILIMFGHVSLMLFTRRVSFAPLRLGCYLMFAGCCLLSQAIGGAAFSMPSLIELLLIYSFFTVTTYVSDAAYLLIMRRFVAMMVIPAFIVLIQYWYQKITGLSDPISMHRLVPKTFLLQGFFYDAHYPWNSPFQRPNGFFFLEPSVVSMYSASAAIIELTYFKRPRYVLLMIASTAFSMGGTGMTMLAIAAPFLLVRQSVRTIFLVAAAALIAAIVLYGLDIPIPMLSRANELQHTTTSGGGRILIPAQQFLRLLLDPSHILTGNGAGATTAAFGNAWPIVKLLNEYGLLTTILYAALFLMAIVRPYNVPLAIALSIMFHFTGGYLLDGTIVQFIAVVFCMIIPTSSMVPLRSRYIQEASRRSLRQYTHPFNSNALNRQERREAESDSLA